MKTTLNIDIDTERENPLIITKPDSIPQPTTPEEAREMLLTDIGCICETLCMLIHLTDQSGYAPKKELVEVSIKVLNDMLVETPKPQLNFEIFIFMDNQITQEQIAAREKAIAIIDSCIICEHFENGESFIELFLKQFKDLEAYNELMVILKNKKLELNCHE